MCDIYRKMTVVDEINRYAERIKRLNREKKRAEADTLWLEAMGFVKGLFWANVLTPAEWERYDHELLAAYLSTN